MSATIGRGLGIAIGIGAFVTIGLIATTGQYVPGVPHVGSFTAPATLTNLAGNAISIASSGADADNRGIQIHQSSTGASAGGYRIVCDGAATQALCALFSCLNGTTCRAFESSDGNVKLHQNGGAGTTTFKGQTTFLGATLQIGETTQNTNVNEAHLLSPTQQANCTTGGGNSISGSNFAMTAVTGASSTACTIQFSTPTFANPPTCNVVANVGSQQSGTTYTTTAGQLQITASPNAASYHITCVGH